jgi:hypothetical protein
VHGWSHGMSRIWTLCFAFFFVNRYFMAVNIFPSTPTFRYVSGGVKAYLCPFNYFWGALMILAFRAIVFPPGASKVICFVGNKCFMLHLIDHVMSNFGSRAWNLLRSWERIHPPKMAIANLCLATLQTLLFGVYLEIYRERSLTRAFKLLSVLLKWIAFTFRSFSLILGRLNVFSYSKASSHPTDSISKQSKSITLHQHDMTFQ